MYPGYRPNCCGKLGLTPHHVLPGHCFREAGKGGRSLLLTQRMGGTTALLSARMMFAPAEVAFLTSIGCPFDPALEMSLP